MKSVDQERKVFMKRFIAFLVIVVMLLPLNVFAEVKTQSYSNAPSSSGERVMVIDEDNLGYPSVYTVSPRGRGYLLTSFIFDTLTWKDDKGVVPMLAKSWLVSNDNLIWTFYLAGNAKFTDGKPVTAKDVKFSYEYMMKHPHQWVNLNMIKEVNVMGDYVVQISLKEVYAPFITDVAGNVPIMPMHIWKDVNEPQKFNSDKAVIGSGPFKLTKYDKDAGTYIYEANKDYFLGSPVVDKLIFTANSQPALSLKNGELGAAQKLKYGEALAMKQDSDLKVMEGPGLWVYRMYFNFDLPEFNSKEVRQALYYAIDRASIVSKVLKNGGIPGNPGHIHPDSQWYSEVKDYEYSKTKAAALLDGINAKDTNKDGIREYKGKKMEYELLTTDDKVGEAEMVKGYLGMIGIKLNVKAVDQKSVDALIKDGKFQLALNGHGSFGGDPVLLARFVSKDVNIGSTPSVTAQGGKQWSNREFDKVFEEQLKDLNSASRYKKVGRLQQIIAEELPTLTLYYRKITFAYDPGKLNGWFFTKDGVAIAVPTAQNKLVYIRGTWGK